MTSPRLLVLALCLVPGGCATSSFSSQPVRDPLDPPARFEPVEASARLSPGDTLAGGGCLSPLVDPRDGTRIRMLSAASTRGDYAVEDGRYGVRDGEALRIECNTGRPLGIVRRN